MIACSDLQVGKPLHMCIGTARFVCASAGVHTRTLNTTKAPNLFVSFLIPFHACDTLPQVFWCTLTLESNLLTFLKTQA